MSGSGVHRQATQFKWWLQDTCKHHSINGLQGDTCEQPCASSNQAWQVVQPTPGEWTAPSTQSPLGVKLRNLLLPSLPKRTCRSSICRGALRLPFSSMNGFCAGNVWEIGTKSRCMARRGCLAASAKQGVQSQTGPGAEQLAPPARTARHLAGCGLTAITTALFPRVLMRIHDVRGLPKSLNSLHLPQATKEWRVQR